MGGSISTGTYNRKVYILVCIYKYMKTQNENETENIKTSKQLKKEIRQKLKWINEDISKINKPLLLKAVLSRLYDVDYDSEDIE